MNAIASSRKISIYCDVALVVALLLTGLSTAVMWHVLTTPLPKGEHRIDLVDEIETMASILNLILPVGIISLLISTIVKIRDRTLEPFSAAVALAGSVGVFACAIAMYGAFVAVHPGINLWSKIWWRFGT